MKKFTRYSSLQFLTPWHASVLNAKASTSKSNNGMKLIKPQYSFLMNMKLMNKNKKKIKLMIYFLYRNIRYYLVGYES